jgi:hypothetical protein
VVGGRRREGAPARRTGSGSASARRRRLKPSGNGWRGWSRRCFAKSPPAPRIARGLSPLAAAPRGRLGPNARCQRRARRQCASDTQQARVADSGCAGEKVAKAGRCRAGKRPRKVQKPSLAWRPETSQSLSTGNYRPPTRSLTAFVSGLRVQALLKATEMQSCRSRKARPATRADGRKGSLAHSRRPSERS